MNGDTVMTIWVIYYGARNHPPGLWVVRAQDVIAGQLEPRPHEVFFECRSLAAARASVPPYLHRMDRYPGDHPTIVETWF